MTYPKPDSDLVYMLRRRLAEIEDEAMHIRGLLHHHLTPPVAHVRRAAPQRATPSTDSSEATESTDTASSQEGSRG